MTSRGSGSDEWGEGDEAPRDPVGPYTLAYFSACLVAIVVTIAVTYSSMHVLSVRMSAARVIALEQSQVLDLQHLGRTAVDLSGAPVTVVLPRANVRAGDSVCIARVVNGQAPAQVCNLGWPTFLSPIAAYLASLLVLYLSRMVAAASPSRRNWFLLP